MGSAGEGRHLHHDSLVVPSCLTLSPWGSSPDASKSPSLSWVPFVAAQRPLTGPSALPSSWGEWPLGAPFQLLSNPPHPQPLSSAALEVAPASPGGSCSLCPLRIRNQALSSPLSCPHSSGHSQTPENFPAVSAQARCREPATLYSPTKLPTRASDIVCG